MKRFHRGVPVLGARAAILTFLLALAPPAMAARWYVDAAKPAGGNGQSWGQAFRDLQNALDVAVAGDEIWVAAGAYEPSVPSTVIPQDDRTFSFTIAVPLSIHGGFRGFETSLAERVPQLAESSWLDGNIGSNLMNSDNAYNVVTIKADGVLLDRFRVWRGNGTNPSAGAVALELQFGGGLRVSADATLRDLVIKGSLSMNGGGMAVLGDGVFVLVDACNFEGNVALTTGGGLRVGNNATPVQTPRIEVYNSTFRNNESGLGGGMYSRTLDNTSPNPTATSFTNCLFDGNLATGTGQFGRGGAMYRDRGQLTVFQCTLSDNVADVSGGGIYRAAGEGVFIFNSILWGDHAGSEPELSPYVSGNFVITTSDVQGLGLAHPNMDADPQFLSGTLIPSASSPVINAAQAAQYLPDLHDWDNDGDFGEDFPYDILLNPRLAGSQSEAYDMGAYEYQL